MNPRKKILVIYDDAAIVEFLRAKLADHDVVATESARDAVALAREHRPDLIVCDINMPEVDGADISAQLFDDASLRAIPFVYLTGIASPRDLAARSGHLGGRPAISKHLPPEKLLARVRELLGA